MTIEAAVAAAAPSKEAQALQKRYQFWKQKMNLAVEEDNAEGVETASAQLAKIEEEAKSKNVSLLPEITTTEPAPKSKSKSVAGKEKVAARAAALAETKAKTATSTSANGEAKPKRVKAAPVLRPCLDGCGTEVPGNFKMGHDAKLKSMILKIERGEMDMNELPDIAQELVGFKKGEKEEIRDSKGKKTGETQLYTCTKAPVRFQGRPEIQFTTR